MRNFTRVLALLLTLAMCLSGVSVASAAEGKLNLGYCESDPYVEFDIQLYYLLLGMEEYGLISGVAGQITEDMTAAQMWALVSAINDPAWKVHFSEDVYVSLIDHNFSSLEEEAQYALIDSMIASAGVNLMLTMGTSAGLAIAALPSGVPLVNFVAADPYKSGIVADTASSGR